MSKQDLEEKLARMSSYTTPPADVLADVLAAYEERVAELVAALEKERGRVLLEVNFQHSIREQERQTRAEQRERHEAEKRHLIEQIKAAAKTYSRVVAAKRDGRKTVRIDSVLENS